MMFTAGFDFHKDLRWSVGDVVFIVVAKNLDTFVAGTDQARAQKKHPLRSSRWLVCKLLKSVRSTVIV